MFLLLSSLMHTVADSLASLMHTVADSLKLLG